ncbi:MAG: hypothetical protein LIO97_13045, partial [Tannerellaceae bacterium]|nr:hypothetical protein [Tannerellaceae bacterium]
MFIHEFKIAGDLLDEALEISKYTDDFGVNYLNHNLGVKMCFEGLEPEKALDYFNIAEQNSDRKVDFLIIQCNQYALRAWLNDFTVIPKMQALYKEADKTGENEYIIHTGVNLSKILLESGRTEDAYLQAETIQEKMLESKSYYRFMVWYKVSDRCCVAKEIEIPEEVKERFVLLEERSLEFKQSDIYFDYLLLTLQYW